MSANSIYVSMFTRKNPHSVFPKKELFEPKRARIYPRKDMALKRINGKEAFM